MAAADLLVPRYQLPPEGIDMADFAGDPDDLLHEATYCDLCMTLIRGPWYRCAYCSSDMCDLHEQTHNEDHCCMVFKAKVDLQILRYVSLSFVRCCHSDDLAG